MRETTERAMPAENTVRELLDAQPWKEIFQRLTTYANMLMKQRVWRGGWGGAVPGGREAMDFAIEAIEDVYSGKRGWNSEKYPDLNIYLRMVVKSKISNAATRAENQDAELPEEEIGKSVDSDDVYYWAFLDYLKDEPLLQQAVECFFEGYGDRATIAMRLKIDVNDVTNLRKKLSRRLTDFQRFLSDEEKRR